MSPIACNCGKNKRLPGTRSLPAGRTAPGTTTSVFFYAIPPEGEGEPERFPTLREARIRAQRGGRGWEVAGRKEAV